jgi:hypothetical protein
METKLAVSLSVARGGPPEVFDRVKEPLDAVMRVVEHRAEEGLPTQMNHRRYVQGSTGGFDPAAQPIAIIGLYVQCIRQGAF